MEMTQMCSIPQQMSQGFCLRISHESYTSSIYLSGPRMWVYVIIGEQERKEKKKKREMEKINGVITEVIANATREKGEESRVRKSAE